MRSKKNRIHFTGVALFFVDARFRWVITTPWSRNGEAEALQGSFLRV
jgi:hypothetical protein